MWPLVNKEFVQLRLYAIPVVGLMVLWVVALGRVVPTTAITVFNALSVAMAFNLPAYSFAQEERNSTFVFMRTLPLRPHEIVAAKYLATGVFTVAVPLLGLALGPLSGLVGPDMLIRVTMVLSLSLFLGAVNFFLHFWLGLKAAKSASLVVLIGVAAVVVLLISNVPALAELVQPWLARLAPLAASWGGVALAMGLGLAVYYLSYLGAARLFAGRDVTRLP